MAAEFGDPWGSEEEEAVDPREETLETMGRGLELPMPGKVRKHQHKHSVKHRYEVLGTLGRGTYGKVKQATERGTNRMVAIKSIRKDKITDELDQVHLQREIEILALLKHPNIVQVFEVFENRDKLILVMEYASNGELYDYINNRGQISENEARGFFRQIVSAVHYCHKKGVVHRDLKLENILLDEKLNVKLADFGLSNKYSQDQMMETYCGSPLYASPEIVKGLPYQGPEVDCWALGVLLYALVYGNMPFDSNNYKVLTEQIGRGDYRKPPHVSGACGLIDWLLTVHAKGRATIENVANHWWVNWGYGLVVCDCEPSPECQSPLLARYIDGQNGFPEGNFSPGPTSGEGKPGGNYKACLRKSKKENDIQRPQQDPASQGPGRKPKGILKKRSSLDSTFFPSPSSSPNLAESEDGVHPGLHLLVVPDLSQPETRLEPPKMPKKGILKQFYQRESGYSSSPERGAASGGPGREGHTSGHTARSERGVQRQKGILKQNGRFSTSLDLPLDCSSLRLSDSLEALILAGDGQSSHPSRPPSVISDDSFLSGDSFDFTDVATGPKGSFLTIMSGRALGLSSAPKEDLNSPDTVCHNAPSRRGPLESLVLEGLGGAQSGS
ncbi:NUAK family SNF1-like kinase 1 isoform X1 [Tachyglossus aculeatus]|uniref:NUAK family SNF1-like kinase 1 isoform X1 n=1 Tax=Tachyglossus aculeatus TaxID=9261 RepID=UPI0018F442E0|nr:NUAK family SNF1-like kinase 1 isoform X1 [Tachyglossus aculeatus]